MITTSHPIPMPPGLSTAVAKRRPASASAINIETARLSLNALKPNDERALLAVFGSRETARQTHTIAYPFTSDDARDLIAKAQEASFDLPMLGIHNEEGHLIGIISLSAGTRGGLHQLGPNLGVFIAPDYQRNGYAPEAIEGLIKWVRKNHLHTVIQAAHFADNLPSSELLTRSGFLYTGRKTQETSRAREGEHLALHMIRLI